LHGECIGIEQIEDIAAQYPARRDIRTGRGKIPIQNPDIAEKSSTGGDLNLFYNLKNDTSSFLG